jgi:hypothetical protein
MLRSDLREPAPVAVVVVGDIGLRSSVESLFSFVPLESLEARLSVPESGAERVEVLRLPLL